MGDGVEVQCAPKIYALSHYVPSTMSGFRARAASEECLGSMRFWASTSNDLNKWKRLFLTAIFAIELFLLETRNLVIRQFKYLHSPRNTKRNGSTGRGREVDGQC